MRYPWREWIERGRSRPGVSFLPSELAGVDRRMASVVRDRRVRALHQPDGRLMPVVQHYNPDTGMCDVWLRWVPYPTVRNTPAGGGNGRATEEPT